MLGLFGTLNLGTRSLQTQQMGVEVAGQNLANVNNPAYARQRVSIQAGATLPSSLGPQGTGADAVAITQIRSALLDGQMQRELSVGGYWNAQQSALQSAQANLGEFLDRQAQSLSSSSAAGEAGAGIGLADDLSGLFNAFQAVATSPASLTERQVLLNQAQTLTTRFNQAATRLVNLGGSLDASLNNDVTAANQLLTEIAKINDQIVNAELPLGGVANDLRDLRQQKLEELAKLVDVQTGAAANGTVTVSIGGTLLVSDRNVLDTLQTYDAGGGQWLVRTATGGTPLSLAGGSMQGTMEARDGALATLRNRLDTLAGNLITEVNALHGAGFSLTGSTGADFFTGTNAATIAVNATLRGDPSLLQAAGMAGASGDNAVALALARLADRPMATLGNQTFSGAYGQAVAQLGFALSNANSQMASHEAVKNMLTSQRSSVSGVSVDEEMTDLMRYQKAYQASARLVTTIDEMLDTVLNLKR